MKKIFCDICESEIKGASGTLSGIDKEYSDLCYDCLAKLNEIAVALATEDISVCVGKRDKNDKPAIKLGGEWYLYNGERKFPDKDF